MASIAPGSSFAAPGSHMMLRREQPYARAFVRSTQSRLRELGLSNFTQRRHPPLEGAEAD